MSKIPENIKIYKIVNLINGKIYIGQTAKVNYDWKRYYGGGVAIKLAIKKYGKENFSKEILIECKNQKDANECEIKFIKKFDSINKGYNFVEGGLYGVRGLKFTNGSKDKMKASSMKRWMNMTDNEKSRYVKKGWNKERKKILSEKNKKFLSEKNRLVQIEIWNNMTMKKKSERMNKLNSQEAIDKRWITRRLNQVVSNGK